MNTIKKQVKNLQIKHSNQLDIDNKIQTSETQNKANKNQIESTKNTQTKKSSDKSSNKCFIKFLRGDYRKVSSADLQACARKLMQLVKEYRYIKSLDLKKEKQKKDKYKSETTKNIKQEEKPTLKQIIQTKSLLHYLCTSFEYMYHNKIYIRYYRNTTGLSHHNGLASARRPLKCYLYCIEYLKGLRGFINYLDKMNYEYDIEEVLTNQTGQRNAGGYRKFSKGRIYAEDRSKHNLVFKVSYGPK